jgi:GrpB-like predicted nucleotidyltransferase (UPF0157 family)
VSDAIALAPPDPAWPARFAAEAGRLRAALPADLACTIEHFGSTAVPDMPAKPIVDVMMIVHARTRWGEIVAPLEGLGYAYWRDNPAPDRMLFVKGLPPAPTGRTHHVHVRLPEDARAELRFRDALRADRALAQRYLALKIALAARHREDREAYTEGKTEFVAAALAALDRG